MWRLLNTLKCFSLAKDEQNALTSVFYKVLCNDENMVNKCDYVIDIVSAVASRLFPPLTIRRVLYLITEFYDG